MHEETDRIGSVRIVGNGKGWTYIEERDSSVIRGTLVSGIDKGSGEQFS